VTTEERRQVARAMTGSEVAVRVPVPFCISVVGRPVCVTAAVRFMAALQQAHDLDGRHVPVLIRVGAHELFAQAHRTVPGTSMVLGCDLAARKHERDHSTNDRHGQQ
jgi:hypothetical protein